MLSDSGEDAKVKGTRKVGGAKKRRKGREKETDKNIFFLAPSSQGRSSVPSLALLCAGNLVNIRSTQKLSCISLFHARGLRMPSFWVTGTTRFESVDIICQIWPIKGYTRGWYTGTGRLKKWLQALPSNLSPVSSRFILSSHSLNSAGPTISEPGTGYNWGSRYNANATTSVKIYFPLLVIIVSLRSDDGEILRRQTWSRGLGVRSPSQWREK